MGLTGQLSSIEVYMFASEPNIASDVTIDIMLPEYQGVQLDVTGTPIASSIPVPGSSIPASDGRLLPPSNFFVSFDLSAANLQVVVGQQLVFLLRGSPPSGNFVVLGRSPGAYSGGNAYTGSSLLDASPNMISVSGLS